MVTDAFGNVIIYVRDGNSWITREEYWENTATGLVLRTAMDFTYDAKGAVATRIEASGTPQEKTTIYTYEPRTGRISSETVASVVDPAQNRVLTNVYDETTGNLLSTTETGLLGNGAAYAYTTMYTYASNGKIATIDGPRTDVSDVTTYYYDPLTGNLNGVEQPLVGTTIYSNHDALGNPQTVTDPNGNIMTYTYDAAGRVTSVKAPGDTNATQYVYFSGGCSSCGGRASNRIDHITLPEGNSIWYTYDAMGNQTAIKDSENNTINYTYDSEGNKLTEETKDNAGSIQKSLSYSYDALNRLQKIKNPDATYTEYGYDSRGNRRSLKDPNGNTTTYSYDAFNQLTSVVQPGNVTTSYSYDTSKNLTSVIDANGNATTYRYDDKGRVYQVISPDTGTTTYSYDPAGNMISKTDAKSVTISYQYDALDRLTKIDFPADTDIVYAYDTCVNGKGRLCSMTDASGTTVYEYTAKTQVRKETKTIDSVQYVTQYTYDQNGNMKTMTYPSGRVITYNLSNDRVISVLNNAANLAANINYKPFGGMSSLTYGNGMAGSISYDNQYRVSSITAGAVMNLSYPTYDANGNIMAINNVLDPAKSKSFTYDSLDRLSTATASGIWGSLAWTYDGVGNRQTEGATSYLYQPNTNKVNAVGGISYGFDNNGNTKTEGARQFEYNQNQRIIRVVDSGVTKGEYAYNGNGQRVKKVVNGTTTVSHYNQSGQIIAESGSAGVVTAEYVYVNGNPFAKIENGNTYYYHNDHLGTPQKMTDGSGAVVWAADYKPFGEGTITVSTSTNNLRFPGQYYDAETGLSYNYYRDYNPAIGRYVEVDPIGLLGQKNHLYVYASNNSLKNSDPLGLFPGSCGNIRHTWVPDNPLIVFSFDTSCLGHDMCYGCSGAGAGVSKEQCDLAFRTSMQSVCRFYRLVPALYNSCMALADTYYLAVSLGGNTDFTNARAGCCSR